MTEPVPTERPTGVPLKFIPADTRGDMVLRKGVKIQGAAEILVSVFTRARGEKAAHGVVIEAYDPATCYTSTLHVEASELVRQVGGAARLSLLDDASVRGTVEASSTASSCSPRPSAASSCTWMRACCRTCSGRRRKRVAC